MRVSRRKPNPATWFDLTPASKGRVKVAGQKESFGMSNARIISKSVERSLLFDFD